jgi:hypothetical protein
MNPDESKVLVMPVISMSNKTFNSSLLDANYVLIWSNNIGKENVIPLPYVVLIEIPFALELINIIAKTMMIIQSLLQQYRQMMYHMQL